MLFPTVNQSLKEWTHMYMYINSILVYILRHLKYVICALCIYPPRKIRFKACGRSCIYSHCWKASGWVVKAAYSHSQCKPCHMLSFRHLDSLSKISTWNFYLVLWFTWLQMWTLVTIQRQSFVGSPRSTGSPLWCVSRVYAALRSWASVCVYKCARVNRM